MPQLAKQVSSIPPPHLRAPPPPLPSPPPTTSVEKPHHHDNSRHEKKLRSIVIVKIVVIAIGFFLGHVIFHALMLLYDNFYASVFAPSDKEDDLPIEPGSKTAWMHAIYFAAFTILICCIIAFILYLAIARLSAAPPDTPGDIPGSEYTA